MASIWRVLCPVFVVLASGLVAGGCSKEEKSFDVFVAPEPKVVRSSGVVSVSDWDKDNFRALDLHDGFDLTESKAAFAKLISRCDRADFHLKNEVTFQNPKLIKVFQILPQEFLVADYSKAPLKCTITIALSNSIGSRYIFDLKSIPILDNANTDGVGEGEVTIEDSEVIRYYPVSDGLVVGICTDLTTNPVIFRQISEMKFVDFNNPIMRDNRTDTIRFEKPVQYCRIGIFQNDQLVAISHKFRQIIPRLAMPMSVDFHAPGDVIREDFSTYDYSSFFSRGLAKELARFSFKNPHAAPRQIQIPKKRHPGIYEMYSRTLGRPDSAWYKFPVPRDWIFLVPYSGPGSTIEDNGEYWMVTLTNINSSFAVSIFASAAPGSSCVPTNNEAKAVLIYPAQPILLTEVMANGDKVTDVELKLNDKVMIGFGADVSRAGLENAELLPNTYCNWPL
jgi:hypothetical protein